MYLTKERPSFPLEVEWSITWHCDASCLFCSTSNYSTKSIGYRSITDSIINCKPLFVTLSGGEPLLHPHINEIINLLTQESIAVNLTTNGQRLTSQYIRDDSIISLNWTRVSIHSGIECNARKLMGKQYSLSKVKENIKRYLERSNNISLFSLVVNEISLEEDIPSVIQLASELEIKKITVGEIRKLGKAKNIVCIDNSMLADRYARLSESARNSGILLEHPPSRSQELERSCPTAATSFAVNPDGSVRSCTFSEEILGVLPEDNLESIWRTKGAVNFSCKPCNN